MFVKELQVIKVVYIISSILSNTDDTLTPIVDPYSYEEWRISWILLIHIDLPDWINNNAFDVRFDHEVLLPVFI